jgi:hypothetical protein
MKLVGVVSALLVGLVAAKDWVEWEGEETNSIAGVQTVIERLLEGGLETEKVPEVKALLEQHNDPFLDCGCPRGFSLFIDSVGVATCQRVCFRSNISCVSTPPTPSVLGTCAGFESIPRSQCRLGKLIAGCACHTGATTCGSFLFYAGNYLCFSPTTIIPDVTRPGCPDRTNAFCWQLFTNTCTALTTEQQRELLRVPCITCDQEPPFVPPCRDPCRDRTPCGGWREPSRCDRPGSTNWEGFCERDDCNRCHDRRGRGDRDLARKSGV